MHEVPSGLERIIKHLRKLRRSRSQEVPDASRAQSQELSFEDKLKELGLTAFDLSVMEMTEHGEEPTVRRAYRLEEGKTLTGQQICEIPQAEQLKISNVGTITTVHLATGSVVKQESGKVRITSKGFFDVNTIRVTSNGMFSISKSESPNQPIVSPVSFVERNDGVTIVTSQKVTPKTN